MPGSELRSSESWGYYYCNIPGIVVVRAIARPLHAALCTLLSAQISGHYIRPPSAGEYKSVTGLAYDNVFVASRLVYEKSVIHCEYVDLCVKLHITILRTEMFSRKLRGVSRWRSKPGYVMCISRTKPRYGLSVCTFLPRIAVGCDVELHVCG